LHVKFACAGGGGVMQALQIHMHCSFEV
jgi:hypothetical protein